MKKSCGSCGAFCCRRENMRILIIWRAQFMGASGGMEKICTDMCNALIRRSHHVGLLYCGEKPGKPFFPISSQAELINMASGTGERGAYMPLWAAGVRECLRVMDKHKMHQWVSSRKNRYYGQQVQDNISVFQPDVLVAFDITSAMLIQDAFHGDVPVPMATMFHFPVKEALRYHSKQERAALQKSGCIQVLTGDAEDWMKQEFPETPVICIPNEVAQYERQADLAGDKRQYTVLHVGRLDKYAKRQHLLIDAFARLADRFPEWGLELWGAGKGKYAEELAAQIQQHHLQNRVFLKGTSNRLEEVYTRADLFCFPSAFEGFGLALAEAMSAGLPAVGFRDCPGVNTLIRDGETGLLAGKGAEGLANAMELLMKDRSLRVRMGQAARETMKAYAPERIWNQWESLLAELARSRQKM